MNTKSLSIRNTISLKVGLFCLFVFLLSGGSAAIGKWASDIIASNGQDVALTSNAVRNHMQADMMHDALRADVFAALLSSNPKTEIDMASVQADLKEHVDSFKASIAENKSIVTDPTVRATLDKLDAPLEAYISGAGKLIDAAAKHDPATIDLLPEFRKQFSDLEEAMANAGDVVEANAGAINDANRTMADEIGLLLMGMVGLTALLSLVMFVSARRVLVNPLKTLSATMQALAKGATDAEIKGANRSDEIGDMARNVVIFRDAAIEKRALEAAATEAQRKSEEDQYAMQQKADEEAAERLRVATRSMATALKRLADGDLSFEMERQSTPDFEQLRVDFNQSLQQLSDTMSRIAQASTVIDTGSREISEGADQLSRRTEQQAASLEQTAAALDEITINVNSASRRVDEALSISGQATNSASRSGDIVKQAVSAMTRIEQASNQISNIIGVIDEIAFQTNLLALNAGVEAARAGDAGKGFAVVAQEVRELAQRSAAAAKEIKGQIQSSNREVESGVTLVRETGDALTAIQDFIIHINDHMKAIATATREQAVGLSEINNAVNQMDQMTQQNAAMVEETTAASMNLATEAKELTSMLKHFRTRAGTTQSSQGQQAYRRSA